MILKFMLMYDKAICIFCYILIVVIHCFSVFLNVFSISLIF